MRRRKSKKKKGAIYRAVWTGDERLCACCDQPTGIRSASILHSDVPVVSPTLPAEKIQEIYALVKGSFLPTGHRLCVSCKDHAKRYKMYVYTPVGSTMLHGPVCVNCLAWAMNESPDHYEPEVWEVAMTKATEKRIGFAKEPEPKPKVRRRRIDVDTLF